jgi:hypothetical protein
MKVNSQEEDLIQLKSNIEVAADNLLDATSSLKSCYIKNASSLSEFVKLRRLVTNDVRVYSTKVLPFSIKTIKTIKVYFDNYDKLTFEKFKKYISVLTEKAENSIQLCNYIVKLHTSLLTNLMERRDDALKVSAKLKLETKALEEKIEKFKRKHKIASAWTISLAFVPYVNMIAFPIIGYVVYDAKQDAIAIEKEKELVALVTICIEEPLIKSVQRFINAISLVEKLQSRQDSDIMILI